MVSWVSMRLSTQLSLAFLVLGVLPLAGVTLYSYVSSARAYRELLEAENARVARAMSQRLGEAAEELSSRIEAMRTRPRERASNAFEEARANALQAARTAGLKALLQDVLSTAKLEVGQIAFAIDSDGSLLAVDPADLPKLYGLGLGHPPPGIDPLERRDWVKASYRDERSGVTLGVAGPLGKAFSDMRLTAVRNLGYGLALVTLALFSTLPLSRRLTSQLESLTEGVERLGRGEADVQVSVPQGAEELARLASTFNRMARDLETQQRRLLEQERLRKELEISRRIQEELLPRGPARFAFGEAAGLSIPAREVGGDFFNYFELSRDSAAILIGDVSGKGVPAAILMANLQATLRARLPLENDLAALVERLDHELGVSDPGGAYLTLFVGILDSGTASLRYLNAGHVTQLLLRSNGTLLPLESSGRPPGLLPGGGYTEGRIAVEPEDVLVLFTDGLLDAESPHGEDFGMDRLMAVVGAAPRAPVGEVLAQVDLALRAHRGGTEAGDDATLVALRVWAKGASPTPS